MTHFEIIHPRTAMYNRYVLKKLQSKIPDETSEKGRLFRHTCKYFHADPVQVMSNSRKEKPRLVRQIAIYIMRKYMKLPSTEVGSFFNRHHATVLHSETTIQNYIDTDNDFRARIGEFIETSKFLDVNK